MQAFGKPGSQILDGFTDRDLGTGTAAFLFFDLLQIAVNRAFRAGVAQFATDGIDRRVTPHRQQVVSRSYNFRFVDSGSGHGILEFRTVLRNMILHTNFTKFKAAKIQILRHDNG